MTRTIEPTSARPTTVAHLAQPRHPPYDHPRAEPARMLAAVAVPVSPASVPALRRLARSAVRAGGLPQEAGETLELIVSELATNIVLHSGATEAAMLLSADDCALTVWLRDNGRWRERSSPRCEPADAHAAFGRGLALVYAHSSETCVLHTTSGTMFRAVVAF